MLAKPFTVNTTLPVVAPAGTGTTTLVAAQLVGVAAVPLNVTVLVPCVAPNVVPVIVTDVATGPLVGESDVMAGGTVKGKPLLINPTVTTTFPVTAAFGTGTTILVADQLVGVAVAPPILTTLAPLVAPNPEPVIVIGVPTGPLVGARFVKVGRTRYDTPLLGTPSTVTTTLPVAAPVGTVTTMLVADQLVGVAAVPLNVTVFAPCVAPNPVPAIVTDVPIGPLVGFRLVIAGGTVTVNGDPLLGETPTVTTTLPVVAPAGTGTTILVADQLVGVADIPLKAAVLVPCVAPKFVPVIVTDVATTPVAGDSEVIDGGGVTVNPEPLLARPPTVTTTLPVDAPPGTATTMLVADQLVGVTVIPANCTVLVPCVAPKALPAIVTAIPMGPLDGDSEVIAGAVITVNAAPLLAAPPTMTTTFPLAAPAGTGTTMLVGDQLVGVATMPPNVTVLAPCVAPNVVPAMVTDVPTIPLVGVNDVMDGGTVTVNGEPALARPPTDTTTLPVVAPNGTGTTMLVNDQLVGVAAVPLKVTVLVPWVAPKSDPVMVTTVPTAPVDGERFVAVGPAVDVS